ncbi:pentatricopeptide repeat-containing protein [Quercus suber]|uniref:Pentatricopeptide repeat-containing protein n=1 Tax=Quercus suber TaxID=58331 RepID=A0AAW0JUS5_QUESU|nr:pentatricopeptide repeat-containing protein, mitochondrial [Quercus suber]
MKEMEDLGLKFIANACFDLIIDGCAKAGKLEESLMHCEKMLERRLVPSCWAFNEMVGKLSEIGNMEQANAMLTILLDRGLLPDEITYSLLIEGKKMSFMKFSNSTMKLRTDHCLLDYWSMRH